MNKSYSSFIILFMLMTAVTASNSAVTGKNNNLISKKESASTSSTLASVSSTTTSLSLSASALKMDSTPPFNNSLMVPSDSPVIISTTTARNPSNSLDELDLLSTAVVLAGVDPSLVDFNNPVWLLFFRVLPVESSPLSRGSVQQALFAIFYATFESNLKISQIASFFKDLHLAEVEDENSLSSIIFSVFTEEAPNIFHQIAPYYCNLNTCSNYTSSNYTYPNYTIPTPVNSLDKDKLLYLFQRFVQFFGYARSVEKRLGFSFVDQNLFKFFKYFIENDDFAACFRQFPTKELLMVAFCFVYWDKSALLTITLNLAPQIIYTTINNLSILQYACKMGSIACIDLCLKICSEEAAKNAFITAIKSDNPGVLQLFQPFGLSGKSKIVEADGIEIDADVFAIKNGHFEAYNYLKLCSNRHL